MTYAAPIADMRFALEACADLWRLRERFPELDADLLAAILDGAGALAADTLAPINRSGDRAGVSLSDGVVARRAWVSRSVRGVQARRLAGSGRRSGLWRPGPAARGGACRDGDRARREHELRAAADADARRHRSDRAARRAGSEALYLEKLVSGEWTGHDEPDRAAGGLRSRRADHQGRAAGRRFVRHHRAEDLHHLGRARSGADNIIHLVLARIEGAPAGSKGISMFIVPKISRRRTDRATRCAASASKRRWASTPRPPARWPTKARQAG